MATQAQIEANRRNAQKSTGPTSEEGKTKSSQNALKLGLFTEQVLLPGEDGEQLQKVRDGIFARLKPADALEELYADRVVVASWRLRRALAGELRTFELIRIDAKCDGPATLGCHETALKHLGNLQRHIASLERGIDRASAELHRLQKARREADERGDTTDTMNRKNEPNCNAVQPGATDAEVASSMPIEIVKTNPIPHDNREESGAVAVEEGEGIRENEPNGPSAPGVPGGGAVHAPTPA
jgi:hypothetical protein